ncbi:MAG: ABC transporter permease [bacterium]
MKRYPIDTIIGLFITYLFFMAIFFGAKAMVGKDIPLNFGDTARGIIIGYLMWLFATSGIQDMSNDISEETLTGTIEQVYLCPMGPILLLLSRTLAALLSTIIFLPIIFYILQLSTGIYLELKLSSTLPILIFTFIGLCGFGFILAGMTLIFKRIDLLLLLMPILLLVLAMIPIETLSHELQVLAGFFPLSQGIKLARLILLEEQGFLTLLKNGEVLVLVLNSICYFLVGVWGYKIADKIARDKGLLGHY